MYLERILGTGTKVNVLNVLVNNPERSFIEKDLAVAAGAAVSEINRQMPDLVNSGLVKLERIGKNKIYTINKKHFLFVKLQGLFDNLNRIFMKAAKKISSYAVSLGVKTVLLVGSVAKGSVRGDITEVPSDIDMIFLVEKAGDKEQIYNEIISFVNRDISLEYGFICYPIVLTNKEYLERLKKGERFIVLAQAEGVELYGKKPRRFK